MNGPIETLSLFVDFAIMHDWNGKRCPKPGQLTMILPDQRREALAGITSDGISQMRIEPWETEGPHEVAIKMNRQILLDFDRKILR
jgi:hypothetical protein